MRSSQLSRFRNNRAQDKTTDPWQCLPIPFSPPILEGKTCASNPRARPFSLIFLLFTSMRGRQSIVV